MSQADPSNVAAARGAAVLLWIVAAGFGVSTLPAARHLLKYRELPQVFGFRAFGGGFFERLSPETFALMLGAFFLVSVAEAYCGLLLWNGSRAGGILVLALLPLEVVFWVGFALPIPPVLAVVRLVLLALAWSSLR